MPRVDVVVVTDMSRVSVDSPVTDNIVCRLLAYFVMLDEVMLGSG